MAELTPAQYAFAESLLASGVSADEALTKIRELTAISQDFQMVQEGIQLATGASAETMALFGSKMLEAASYGAQGEAAARAYAEAVLYENINIHQGIELLDAFTQAQIKSSQANQEQATTTADATNQMVLFNAELNRSAIEAANSGVQTAALKFQQDQLYQAAVLAAQGMGSAANLAAQMASQFNVAEAEAYKLISALRQLQMAQAAVAVKQLNLPTNVQGYFRGMTKEDIDRATAAGKARENYNYQIADTAGKLKIEQKNLGRLSKTSAEYAESLGRIYNLEKQQASEAERASKKRTGGGGGGGGGGAKAPQLTAQEKTNNQLLSAQDSFNNKFEEAELKHYEKLADIQEDYHKQLDKQNKENEKSKRRGRADFYSSLTDFEGVDTQQMAAAYEAAFAEAQSIAQQGKAALSKEFLDLRQSQIEEMAKLEEEAAKIRGDKDLSDQEKSAALEYLSGRKKLIEDAQTEETKQLLEGGDAIENELNERLTKEQEAYAENTEKIGRQADNKADAVISAAERERKAVDATNLSLAEQLRTTTKIADKANSINGGAATDTTVTTEPSDTPQPVSAATALPVTAETSLPIVSAEALLVRQQDMWMVRDQGVIDSLADMTIRLEGKLDAVVLSVNASADRVTSAVQRLEGSFSRSSHSLVGT